MIRYCLIFSYRGNEFYGYQIQKKERTVQEEMEKVLSKIFNEKMKISSSGRTDRGVHALGQVATFDASKEMDNEKLRFALNSLLPKDIHIESVRKCDATFHARFSAKAKTYVYIIKKGEENPFLTSCVFFLHKELNLDKIKEGSTLFLGEHDFRNFCTNKEEQSYMETLYEIRIHQKGDYYFFVLTGTGFKRYMVRMLIGTLLAYERDEISLDYIREKLKKKEKDPTCFKVPAEGLYLKEVYYEGEMEK